MKPFKDILIVEDCQITIAYLTDFFVKAGHSGVHAIKNGTDAIRIFKRKPDQYGLIVLDLELPDMSGINVAQNIRKTEIGQGINAIPIPIVISSAHLTESAKISAFKAGIQGFFPKPISEKSLKTMLRLLRLKSFNCNTDFEYSSSLQ